MITALVPCHDEAPRPELLDAIAAHVDSVLVVADGLPEDPLRRLNELAGARPVKVLTLAGRNGKGSAVAAGLRRLGDAEAVIVLDADGQHPPSAIPAFVAAAQHAELVIGDRLADIRAIPLVRRIGNVAASLAVACATRRRVRDTQCGMRLLRGRALAVEFPSGGYEAETVHLRRCLAAGVTVAWVPIPAIYGDEKSSFRRVRDSVRVLKAALGPPWSAETPTRDPRAAGCPGGDSRGTIPPRKETAMKSILIAIDGSPAAHAAALVGLELAKDEGASVTLFHAVPPDESPRDGGVDEAAAIAERMGVPFVRLTVDGYAVPEILAAADAMSADMIVIGSRGFGALTGTVLGSVSQAVLKRSLRPVLVVRARPVREHVGELVHA